MTEEQPPNTARMLDFKIPLWGVLCALGAAAFFIVSMYFTTNQTARDVAELQILTKAGNTQVTSLAGEQALLRFRMENMEGEIRGLKNARIADVLPLPGVRK